MQASEDLLLERAKAGDEEALQELLERIGPSIRVTLDINPKWRPVLDAWDVMQITYLDAYMDIHRVNGNAAQFRKWLRTAAEHNRDQAIAALDAAKRTQPDHRVSPPAGEDTILWLWAQVSNPSTTPSRNLARKELEIALKQEIDQLPDDYRKVLLGHYFEDLPIPEIAATMERSEGAVYLLRIRALMKLRDRLGSGSAFFTK